MSILVKNETQVRKTDFVSAMQNLKKSRAEFIEELEYMSLTKIIEIWLPNLKVGTRRNYSYYISNLMFRGFIPDNTVGFFNEVPHEITIDNIKNVKGWSEATRQVYAACYISLTAYLNRISQGWFRRAIPSHLNSNRTFFQIRDKCATESLSLQEWYRFIDALEKINLRDSLIAKCLLQGAKRISEVLSLTEDLIDFDRGIIRFAQSKVGGTLRWIPISFPMPFLNALKAYRYLTQDRRKDNNLMFITNTGNKVQRTRLNFSFSKASELAGIKNVTPHVLRVTWVTFAKTQGISDSEIMKVTGHSSSQMVYSYDKTSAEDNYSKKMILI